MNAKTKASRFSLRVILLFIIGCVFLWCSLSLPTVGISPPLLVNLTVCTVFGLIVMFWDRLASIKNKKLKFLKRLCAVILCLLSAGYIGVSICMLGGAANISNESGTLIILGCKVDAGGTPSLMLQRRLKAGIKYLEAHPDAVCIVSGGKGADEPVSEALAMKRFLTAEGIAEDRIYSEERSTNTAENIAFSKEIIDANALSGNIIIATDDFHQLRAQMNAKKHGIEAASSGHCKTPWYLLPFYWTREIVGVTLAFFK